MARQVFEAQRRDVIGKQVRGLRRSGRVPGIIYGPVVTETVPVSVDRRDFLKFYQATGHSTLFDLRWEDGKQSVFIREVQEEPLRREPVHVAFFAPNLMLPVRAMVHIVLHNPAHAVEGIMAEIRTEVEVEALPTDIPHQIDVDVSGLIQPGNAVRVGDLTLPAGVTAITDAGETLVQIESVYRAPEVEEEEVAAAEAAEVTAEAEAAVAAEATAEEAAE